MKVVDNKPRPETPKHLEGLPPELIAQLSQGYKDNGTTNAQWKLREQVIAAFDEPGQVLGLDEIIINIYRNDKRVIKRSAITNLLTKATKSDAGWIKKVKQGHYALPDPEDS